MTLYELKEEFMRKAYVELGKAQIARGEAKALEISTDTMSQRFDYIVDATKHRAMGVAFREAYEMLDKAMEEVNA